MKPPPSGGTTASDLRFLVSVLRTRRTKLFFYGFVFSFIVCTAYMAFNPSSGSGSPWYSEFFATATASTAPYRSQFSSFFSRFFPDAGSPTGWAVGSGANVAVATEGGVLARNQTEGIAGLSQDGVLEKNHTSPEVRSSPNGFLRRNQTSAGVGSPPIAVAKSNQTRSDSRPQSGILKSNQNSSAVGKLPLRDGGLVKNQTAVKTSPSPQSGIVPMKKQTGSGVGSPKNGALAQNQTIVGNSPQKNGPPAKNQTIAGATTPSNSKAPAINPSIKALPPAKDQSSRSTVTAPPGGPSAASLGKSGQKGALGGNVASNFSVSLAKGDGSNQSASFNSKGVQKKENWSLESMKSCDIFHGNWVKDDSYPLYPEGSCPHIDEPFDCHHNGRPDRSYQKLRWQPHGCNIPRLNATDMLERLRGKRLVFVGDSLNRNMWESLVCILRNSVKNKKNVFEASGRHEFRTEGSYSFMFKDYGCSVEFFRSPFLVQEWEMPDTNGKKKETLRLDIIERSSSGYKDADIIVFNTGHWWTHDKTSKGKDYYQEGNRVYSNLNVVEAFHKALNTWAKWVDVNVNPHKTLVFFRGYSASHFSGGQWNSGGQCDRETEPIKNEKYLSPYPPKMSVLESVLKGMKTHINYLNITRMTDYRKEAHPSIYRKPHLTEAERRSPDRYQDCSHWCLPGVPDSWNELLYAQLLIKQHQL